MSTPKHTPEPWGIEPDLNLSHGQTNAIVHRDSNGMGTIIAETYPCNDEWKHSPITEPVGLANSRLIAAAPKLYRMLSEISTAVIEACNNVDAIPSDFITTIDMQELLDEIGTTLDAIDGKEADK